MWTVLKQLDGGSNMARDGRKKCIFTVIDVTR